MQQWAVLVLPHASICDAPPAFTTDLCISLTFFHVGFLDVGGYIHLPTCRRVSSALSPTADKSIRDDENSPNVGRISMEIRSKKRRSVGSDGWCDDEYSNTFTW